MPKLRRMRLCGIGHDSARFDDVTLDFTDRQGRPTNSVVWLRNGGRKNVAAESVICRYPAK